MYPPIQNGMVIGAASHYDWLCDQAEQLTNATEHELAQLLADEGSVEEAISENADVFRAKLVELTAHPERAAEIAATLNNTIRGYLEPWAGRNAERAL
jgi:hypothetical protein